MFRNYLKTAWRSLIRNRTLSFINVFGLALGMTFAILIGLWIQFERGYDTFNKNAGRIAIVEKNNLSNGEKSTTVAGMLPLYDALKANYPEIKRITRILGGGSHGLMAGSNKLKRDGYFVDPDFLTLFSFPAIKGNLATALNARGNSLHHRRPAGLFAHEQLAGEL